MASDFNGPGGIQNFNTGLGAPVPYRTGSSCLLNTGAAGADEFLKCVATENIRDFDAIVRQSGFSGMEIANMNVTNPVPENTVVNAIKDSMGANIDSATGLLAKYGADAFSLGIGFVIIIAAIVLLASERK